MSETTCTDSPDRPTWLSTLEESEAPLLFPTDEFEEMVEESGCRLHPKTTAQLLLADLSWMMLMLDSDPSMKLSPTQARHLRDGSPAVASKIGEIRQAAAHLHTLLTDTTSGALMAASDAVLSELQSQVGVPQGDLRSARMVTEMVLEVVKRIDAAGTKAIYEPTPPEGPGIALTPRGELAVIPAEAVAKSWEMRRAVWTAKPETRPAIMVGLVLERHTTEPLLGVNWDAQSGPQGGALRLGFMILDRRRSAPGSRGAREQHRLAALRAVWRRARIASP